MRVLLPPLSMARQYGGIGVSMAWGLACAGGALGYRRKVYPMAAGES